MYRNKQRALLGDPIIYITCLAAKYFSRLVVRAVATMRSFLYKAIICATGKMGASKKSMCQVEKRPLVYDSLSSGLGGHFDTVSAKAGRQWLSKMRDSGCQEELSVI